MWHKVLAIVINKYKLGTIKITLKDIIDLEAAYPGEMPTVVITDKDNILTVYLTTETEGKKLAEEERRAGR